MQKNRTKQDPHTITHRSHKHDPKQIQSKRNQPNPNPNTIKWIRQHSTLQKTTTQQHVNKQLPSWTSSPAARSPKTCENFHSNGCKGSSGATTASSPPFIFQSTEHQKKITTISIYQRIEDFLSGFSQDHTFKHTHKKNTIIFSHTLVSNWISTSTIFLQHTQKKHDFFPFLSSLSKRRKMGNFCLG